MAKKLFSVLLSALLAGCAYVAVQLAPDKRPSTVRTAAATQADQVFWTALHGGHYDQIPRVLDALATAYLQDPSDAVTAAHIGFMHMWRLAERSRLEVLPPTITDSVMLARRYFKESYRLVADPRVLGFLGGVTIAEGRIHKDEKLVREGYFTLLDAIDAWPEFNYFSAGYGASRLPADSEKFREALEWQWLNLDVCVGEKVDRHNPDFTKYLRLATTEGRKRVCWNSWIAPHNFEGFVLNMGDMLVKAGDWQLAQKIYANAKLSPDYARWKFRAVLEQRIERAQPNVQLFNAAETPGARAPSPMMFNSNFACMACHQT